MNKDKLTFFERFIPYNFSFGLKLNLLVINLIVISLIILGIVGLNLFKRYINDVNLNNLAKITELNRNSVEKEYRNLLNSIKEIPNEYLGEQVNNLADAFNNYEYDCVLQNTITNEQVQNCKNNLKTFYEEHIIDSIKFQKPTFESIVPSGTNAMALQYNYMVKNPYSPEEYYKLKMAEDNTTYSTYHANIQKYFQPIISKNNFQNIYLIDQLHGNIIYSYQKNIAFGNNVFSNYLIHSNLASIFQKVLISDENNVIPSDFEFFIPDYNKPVAFFGVPVYFQDTKKAVLIVEISPEYFNSVLIDKKDINKSKSAKTVSLNIVGKDKILRNQPNEEVLDFENFKKLLQENKFKDTPANLLKTGALTLEFDDNYNLEKTENSIAKNYLGNNAYISSTKLNLNGLDWYLVGQIDRRSVLSFYRHVVLVMLFVVILLVVVSVISTYYFRKSMIGRINQLKSSLNKLAQGEEQDTIETVWRDEIAEVTNSFNELKDRINAAGEFALHLSEGNYKENFDAISENDKFAQSLNTLKKALVVNKQEIDKRTEEDDVRNWINEGIAMFNDLLRQSNDNIQNLAFLIIESLTEYVKANIGGVFLVEGETESAKRITLLASFAYDRRKYTQKTIEIGEGLIGNCYLEKKSIYLKNLPRDYMEISSGLGKTIPNVLYIAPLLYDQEVLGFLEIASLEEFQKHELEFIDKLAENVAATFSTVRLNSKTAELLEESKRRTNEIAQQEEEMRQNMEEMQATQEELARLRNNDEKRQKELQNEIRSSKALTQEIINSMTGEVYVKDSHGVIILSNEELAKRFNSTPEKLAGKSDSELFTPERAQKEQELDALVIQEGIFSDEITELVGTEEQKYFVVKKPFHFAITKETGVITIRNKR